MATISNDPVTLAIRAYQASEGHALKAEAAFAAFVYHCQAIVSDPERGAFAPSAEWTPWEHSDRRKDVANGLRKILFGADELPSKAKVGATLHNKARAERAKQQRACQQAVNALAGIYRGMSTTGAVPMWNGTEWMLPLDYFLPADVVAKVDKVFILGDRIAKPTGPDGRYMLPMTSTTSAHTVRYVEEDEEGNEIEAFAYIRVTRTSIARIGAPPRDERETEEGDRNESEPVASVPLPQATAALHSALAAADYVVSGDVADAFLDMIRAWRDASPGNRKTLLDIATEPVASEGVSQNAA
jgi:hypothetical protein